MLFKIKKLSKYSNYIIFIFRYLKNGNKQYKSEFTYNYKYIGIN